MMLNREQIYARAVLMTGKEHPAESLFDYLQFVDDMTFRHYDDPDRETFNEWLHLGQAIRWMLADLVDAGLA